MSYGTLRAARFCIYNEDQKGSISQKFRNAKNVSQNIGQATLFFDHKIMSRSSSLLKTLRKISAFGLFWTHIAVLYTPREGYSPKWAI